MNLYPDVALNDTRGTWTVVAEGNLSGFEIAPSSELPYAEFRVHDGCGGGYQTMDLAYGQLFRGHVRKVEARAGDRALRPRFRLTLITYDEGEPIPQGLRYRPPLVWAPSQLSSESETWPTAAGTGYDSLVLRSYDKALISARAAGGDSGLRLRSIGRDDGTKDNVVDELRTFVLSDTRMAFLWHFASGEFLEAAVRRRTQGAGSRTIDLRMTFFGPELRAPVRKFWKVYQPRTGAVAAGADFNVLFVPNLQWTRLRLWGRNVDIADAAQQRVDAFHMADDRQDDATELVVNNVLAAASQASTFANLAGAGTGAADCFLCYFRNIGVGVNDNLLGNFDFIAEGTL